MRIPLLFSVALLATSFNAIPASACDNCYEGCYPQGVGGPVNITKYKIKHNVFAGPSAPPRGTVLFSMPAAVVPVSAITLDARALSFSGGQAPQASARTSSLQSANDTCDCQELRDLEKEVVRLSRNVDRLATIVERMANTKTMKDQLTIGPAQ